jgi:NifU-like protein involved in Fe-S cluster formation
MYTLDQHLNSPLQKTKPSFFNASSKITINEIEYSLFLDINKDRIERANFLTSKASFEDALLSILIEQIIGLSLDEIEHLSLEDLYSKYSEQDLIKGQNSSFSIPLHLLFDCVNQFTNEHKVAQLKEDLICRCYNICELELKAEILDGSADIFNLCNKTRASTGCGNCKDDLEAILARYGGKKTLFLNKSNSQWVLFFDDLINGYYSESEKTATIIKFKDSTLYLKESGNQSEIEEFLKENAPFILKLSFS